MMEHPITPKSLTMNRWYGYIILLPTLNTLFKNSDDSPRVHNQGLKQVAAALTVGDSDTFPWLMSLNLVEHNRVSLGENSAFIKPGM